jgi:hypothetical protein
MGKDELHGFVDDLSKQAEYLFVTCNDMDYYERFGID